MIQPWRNIRFVAPLVGFLLIASLWRFYDRRLDPLIEPVQATFPHEGISSAPYDTTTTVFSVKDTHHEVFSHSTSDKGYFRIDFGDQRGLNPNIIPHPIYNDTWIVVAVLDNQANIPHSVWFAELVCNAVFKKDVLTCVNSTSILPIPPTYGQKCVDDLAWFGMSVGPHDARVFFGPSIPYAIYGSMSDYTCFGQWVLDFRLLVDWGFEWYDKSLFRKPTELQRPAPYGTIEKNYFLFWDKDGEMYAHYEVSPKRTFAKMNKDGSIGSDLAPLAAQAGDEKCMAKYMPPVAEKLEGTHQGTNSLSITMCNRVDPSCKVTEANTFIFTIFQHKSYYNFHSVYEPYVMVFQQQAPFEIYGISNKPIWIHGRGLPGQGMPPRKLTVEQTKLLNQTEMFYITSMSWKRQGQKYHGYLDDVMFIGFGIEDAGTGGIDILANDLMVDIGLCYI